MSTTKNQPMKKPSLSVVRNETDLSASIFLYGIIGDYWQEDPLTASRFMKELTALESKYNTVNVHINSPGGDVWEGLAICNAIKASKKDIHTWNDGLAASMAATILVSAKDGNRHAAKGSITMIHCASTFTWGNSEDLRETANALDTHDDVLASFFADATGKTEDEVKALWFDYKDHYLTAQEAADYGLVKIESYESEKVPENIKNMSMQKVAALYNPQIAVTNNDHMFGNKFKNLSALAKVAAADITAAQLQAINDEIVAQEIQGVTLVLDTELETAANAVAQNTTLTAQVTEKDQKITDLTAELDAQKAIVAEQTKKLGKPVEDAGAPPVTKTDTTPKDKKDDEPSYETSYDREMKAVLGK